MKANIKKTKTIEVKVDGFKTEIEDGKMEYTKLTCLITNDSMGKTLSINDEETQFTIPFEAIERYFRSY